MTDSERIDLLERDLALVTRMLQLSLANQGLARSATQVGKVLDDVERRVDGQ